MHNVMQQLRRAVLRSEGARVSDGQLLEAFLSRRDEAAFEALVRRHGPMVLGVCRRVLGNAHDAEDAFQAAFLVLLRKAASLRSGELVGTWLYGVAYRTALKAKTTAARRRARERDMPQPPQRQEPEGHDLLALLDRELSRLPDKYRVPVVLCDLEGRTRKEAAGLLGVPEGTLSSRLATARSRLAGRLARHGPALAGGALAGLLAHGRASAGIPPTLIHATVGSATAFVAGRAVAPPVAALTEGVVRTMLLSKLKIATALVLAACLAGTAAGGLAFLSAPSNDPSAPQAAQAAADEEQEGRERDDQTGKGDRSKAGPVTGSGKLTTRQFKVADFTSVNVSSVFHVNITRGESFRVAATADENVMPFVKVERKGRALTLALDTHRRAVHTRGPLKAAVTMPALEGVQASGASHITVAGFKSDKPFRAKLTGASHLKAKIGAGDVAVAASGASMVSLQGSARDAKLAAAGASHLNLAGLAVQSARVKLSGASHATVNARGKLDYSVSGASHLTYLGKPTIGKGMKSGVSHVKAK
jgi:RNA polymerase sigma factor (sigma-70 family)